MTDRTPESDIREICDAAHEVMLDLPAGGASGSVRQAEIAGLATYPLESLEALTKILGNVEGESPLIVPHVLMLSHGIADCFQASPARGFNVAAATTVLRAQVEYAARVRWFLDPKVDALERTRRYLRWRFDDFRWLRKALKMMSVGDTSEAQHDLEETEGKIIDLGRRAGWEIRPWSHPAKAKDPTYAQLLRPDGRVDTLESITDLVAAVMGGETFYPLASGSAHGSRWAVHQDLEQIADATDDGLAHVRIGGGGADWKLVTSACCASVLNSTAHLAGWLGVEDRTSHLKDLVLRTMTTVAQTQDPEGD